MSNKNFGCYPVLMNAPSAVDAERFRERLATAGYSQSALARKIGVSQATIQKLANGISYGSSHLHKIARILGTTPEYLTGETDDPEAGAFIPPTEEDIAQNMGLVKVEEIDLSYGMGAAFADDGAVLTVERWIPNEWVQAIAAGATGRLTIMRPRGDSMYPTINDRDIVFIDRSRNAIDEQDSIWAVTYSGLGSIKRIKAMPDGSYKMSGDNPQVRDEIAYDGEMFVIGRVVGVIRRL